MADEPNIAFMQEVIEARAKLISPPDYWTTCADADWPDSGADWENPENLVADGASQRFLRFWVSQIVMNEQFREDNNAEFTPSLRVVAAFVIKGLPDIQHEMALASADLIRLFLHDEDMPHPNFSGSNTWGLLSAMVEPIAWHFPKLAGTYAWGIVSGVFDVGVRHPMPKGV